MGRYSPPLAPLRASALSISPGPSSSPSPPTIKRLKFKSTSKRRTASSPGPWAKLNSPKFKSQFVDIDAPMPWLWTCHKCGSRYRLGASRRCLHDGHYFCGGTTTDAITGETKQHKACGSEFDYIGWDRYRETRPSHRQNQSMDSQDGMVTSPSIQKIPNDCVADCTYPSACHWRKHKDRHQQKQKKNVMEHQQPSDPRPRMRRSQTFVTFLPPDRLANPSSSTIPEDAPAQSGSEPDEEAPGWSKTTDTATTTATSFLYRLARAAAEKTRLLTPNHNTADPAVLSTTRITPEMQGPLSEERAKKDSTLGPRPHPSRRSLPATNINAIPVSGIRFQFPVFPDMGAGAEEEDPDNMIADTDDSPPSPGSRPSASPFFPTDTEREDDDRDVSMGDSSPESSGREVDGNHWHLGPPLAPSPRFQTRNVQGWGLGRHLSI